MIYGEDPFRRRPRMIDGQVKMTREVRLDGEKNGRMAVQTRADRQNQTIGWLRKGWRSLGGGPVV